MFADSGFSSSSAKCVKEPTMCVWFLANFRCCTHMVLGTQINIIFRKTKTNCANKWCDSCSILLQFQRKHADACDNSAGVHVHARTDCRKRRRPTVFGISNNATTPIEITNEIPPGSRTWSISFGQYIEVPWSVCHLQCCRGMVENNGFCQINLQHISAPVARTRLMVSTTLLTKFIRHTWTSDCWKILKETCWLDNNEILQSSSVSPIHRAEWKLKESRLAEYRSMVDARLFHVSDSQISMRSILQQSPTANVK